MVTTALSAQSSNRESGQILVLTAVTMIALLGIAALSLDASYMYDKRNRLHAAADAAAKSAAIEVIRNPTVALTSLEAFADQQVAAHGFTPTRQSGTTSVVVNHGPSSGPFAGNAGYVEVIVSESTATFFARILGTVSMTPTASAVAGSANPQTCIIVIEDFSLGNSQLAMNGCGVAVGGNLAGTNPNAVINGTPMPNVGVTGTCSGTCTAMGTLTTGVPTPTDPLAGLALPTNPGGCVAGVAASLPGGCYTSIASSVTTLQSGGIFYVTGDLNIGSLTGTNVMIYLAPGGHLTSGNNKDLHLTAPTSGTYKGIAIFQAPSNANNFDSGNNFTLEVSGAIYMPGSDVDIANHLTFIGTTCTLFIAKSLVIRNGNGAMSNNGCAAAFGGAAYLSVSIAQ